MTGSRVGSWLRKMPGGGKGVALVLAAFLAGWLLSGDVDESTRAAPAAPGAAVKWYTCSMHPQIKLHDPKALCPICAMELIPVTGEGDSGGPRELSMSEAAKMLAEIRTAPVERRVVVKQVALVGKAGYDETRQRTITAWVPGRLDRLYVDYTGVPVRKGAPMAYMYSPELLVAQQALLETDAAYARMKASAASESNIEMQAGTVAALENRLRLWGLTDGQIEEIRTRGTASDHMTILSPISGIVTHKNAVEGDYVRVGSKIYEIADLSRVWVFMDAYESDLAWIRYAQEVEFEAEAYPGETFHGRISFIDPFLDNKTRTVKVRVTVDNTDGRLKPGMFVRARIHARLAAGGRIVEPTLAGKWISPVHPEIVMDDPGECPICGTPLVSSESLGYVGADARAPLVIPATAPLRTGKRAVVYVRVPGKERPTYEGREVLLGPRTQSHYLVREGLEEGEQVVVNGAFKIDSALQILARPSMMSPSEKGKGPEFTAPEEFVDALSPVYQAALDSQLALAADDLAVARQAMERLASATDAVPMRDLAGKLHERWMDVRARLVEAGRAGGRAEDLDAARAAFDKISVAVLEAVQAFGHSLGTTLHEAYCPMAFDDRGAAWLAADEGILNPFFGARMLHCGEIRDHFRSVGAGPAIESSFRAALTPVYDGLLAAQRALAGDDLAAARTGAVAVTRALDGIESTPGPEWLAPVWSVIRARAATAAESVAQADDIAAARAAFERLHGAGLALVRRFGHARAAPLHEAFCPMAFDNRGAAWLQAGEEIANPYFGAAMLKCGEVRATFEPTVVATVPAVFRRGLGAVVESYLKVGAALAGDDPAAATTAAGALADSLAAMPAAALEGAHTDAWRKSVRALRQSTDILRRATGLEEARRPFALLSEALAHALDRFGYAGAAGVVQVHCPMAFDNRGATWLQRGTDVRNPYFGAAMLECGDVRRTFDPEAEK